MYHLQNGVENSAIDIIIEKLSKKHTIWAEEIAVLVKRELEFSPSTTPLEVTCTTESRDTDTAIKPIQKVECMEVPTKGEGGDGEAIVKQASKDVDAAATSVLIKRARGEEDEVVFIIRS